MVELPQVLTPSDTELIKLSNVTKSYGMHSAEVFALRGVNLTIERGEFLAVMGPSGSGKSTCLNVLGCLDKPTSGSYLFRGIEVSKLSRDELALLRRNYLGFVFQGFNLLRRTSAAENVELPLVYRGVDKKERREKALEALNAVGLGDRGDHTPSELSGGQQQRVAIARAIVTQPDVLFADEPTGNLDTERSHETMELLRGLNQNLGITIIMVTHEPEMTEYVKRVVHFKDGVVTSDDR